MTEKSNTVPVDGRRLRTERTKTAIIEAAIALTNEGILVPTAKQISERAGVGMRSFFRRFEDMETLFEAMDLHMRDSYAPLLFMAPAKGELDDRIESFVDMYSESFEQIQYIYYSTKAQLWRSKVLQKNYEQNQLKFTKHLHSWFPEINEFSRVHRDSIYAIASFETLSRLRREQKLSVKASREAMVYLLKSLMQSA